MVAVTPGQAFLNLGKSPKTDSVSFHCRKSRGTANNSTPGDRQSYYEDCHNLRDGSRRTPGSLGKGCLSDGYGLSARTLIRVGSAHNGTLFSSGIFLATEDYCYAILLPICQIRG